jgi:Cytochrome c7 and related cytochrome c
MVVGKDRIALKAVFTAVAFIASLAPWALPLRAQQPAGNERAVKPVPDNPADHTAPVQPIPYSHQTHLAFGLECSMCHANPEPGNLMTFPATSVCMSCHTTVATNKPAIQKLATFAKSGQPIPWVRVYMVTKGVNWTHRKHLNAGMKCETCHGQVADMATMSQSTSVTSMGVCISCHKLNNAPTVCQTCHSWPAN